jgi:pimeloyl-ACP methyl ester carboxylesterase
VIPVVFGPKGKQLLGMYHAPEPATALAGGVVLCNPLGYEAMCTHRTYRHLAHRLAAAGFDVLRFDYQGTGDSSGRSDDPDRVRAWLESIHAAVDELRAIAGVAAIDLFGVRLGATLAALAAGQRRDIRGLVLWAPAVSGRAYVRELRALNLLRQEDGRHARRASEEQAAQVADDAFDPTTLRELSAVDLLAQHGRLAERALVLPRDDLPTVETRLAVHLRECGVDTELRAVPGYAGMVDHPETAVVPSATLDAIVAWLGRPGPSVEHRPPVDRARAGVLEAWSHAPHRAVREEALSFGDGGRLFGILTEGEETSGSSTVVVFLNAGANHRVGPNRLYVSLARNLAARGFPAFRFDVGGLGDGGPAPGMTENRVYSKDSVADVRAAMTFLTSIRDVQRFVLVGICSGGFLAFHTSAEDPRAVGQIVINPQTFEWKQGDSLELAIKKSHKSTRYYRRAMWLPRVWTLALRGEVDFRSVAGALRKHFATRGVARWRDLMARWRGLPGVRTEVERVFRSVSERGERSLLVFSSNDGGLDMIEEHLGEGASSMRDNANFRLEIVEGADHTFTQIRAQEHLGTLVTRFLEAWSGGSDTLGHGGSHAPLSDRLPRAPLAARAIITRATTCRTDSSNAPAMAAAISSGPPGAADAIGRSIAKVS